jgi:Flp pilus assembly protein TadB
MSIAVMLLTAAAVLAWPSAHPVSLVAPGRAAVGDAAVGDAAVGDAAVGDAAVGDAAAGAGTNTDARSARTDVPVSEVAGVIDLLALTLRGGVGLAEAMEAVATRVGGPLGLHLQTVAAAGRWGVEDATAWASVPSAWQPAARALRMAATAGVPPADVLVRAAEEVRRAEQQRLELATATLGVRIVLPLGLAFLPAFVLTTVVPIVLALAQQVLVNQ